MFQTSVARLSLEYKVTSGLHGMTELTVLVQDQTAGNYLLLILNSVEFAAVRAVQISRNKADGPRSS